MSNVYAVITLANGCLPVYSPEEWGVPILCKVLYHHPMETSVGVRPHTFVTFENLDGIYIIHARLDCWKSYYPAIEQYVLRDNDSVEKYNNACSIKDRTDVKEFRILKM